MRNAPRIMQGSAPIYMIIFIIPFLIFYKVIPFISSWTFGGDCLNFTILEQMELFFSVKMGSFPLYCPGFAGGQSSSALTLGQLFHPISWFSSHMPGYWSGKAIEWNVLFRLTSLGLAQLMLFEFLRRLTMDKVVSFLISFVTVYNVQLTHAFFFGATVESWTGLLFLCAAIGLYYLDQNNWKISLLIIGSSYWLICSGHPVMTYYGALGAGIFAMAIPYVVAVILPEKKGDAKSIFIFWMKTALFCGIGVLLSSAFLFPYYWDFLAPGVERLGKSYGWADVYRGTFIGALNNFFQPLDGGGFGGTSLYILVALIPLLFIFRVKIPLVIMSIWTISLLAFLHMLGGLTPVHYLVWKYLPFASHMRIPGRISIIIPVLLMLLLVWIFKNDFPGFKIPERQWRITPMTVLGILAIVLTTIHFMLPGTIVSDPYIYSIKNSQNVQDWVLTVNSILGLLMLAIFSVRSFLSGSSNKQAALYIMVSVSLVQAVLLLQNGVAVEPGRTTLSLEQMIAQKNESLEYRYFPAWGIESNIVKVQAERSFIEPFLGKLYPKYISAQDNENAYSLMQQGRSPDQVIIEGIDPQELPFQDINTTNHTGDYVKLIYASFNRLVFEASATYDGFLGLSYPFTGNWVSTVNGNDARVFRANGAYHAVVVPEGKHLIEFSYRSNAAIYGMGLSCLTVFIIGLYFLRRFSKKMMGLLFTLITAVLGITTFVFWYQGLYAGDNLSTFYWWEPPSIMDMQNIAYGKRTRTSPVKDRSYLSQMLMEYPYMRSGGKAVDGDRSQGSGFFTGLQSEPWWMVDLYKNELIKSVVIYESRSGDEWNKRPLIVAFSDDARSWKGTPVSEDETPIRINLMNPVSARYVMVSSSGTCRLSFDEIEIYPPD